MLSCKLATRLLSAGQDRKLTLSERFQIEMHLAMCTGCSNFRKQVNFLRVACRRFPEAELKDGDESGKA
ncbi:MAG: hypothetical protein A3H93_17595 [Rhodocyclales bacterium RIFCSPLOWO2_02_FULL_63_24]|nr:MAG: hypothetical protein A2040_16140 [Rhodocyclales bacterium GWA2_65_19]OHC68751.1 MAG: hypothetical protein A3H93_17595 [Rhodocyclales bacterium RIFCSPLOWO2_02_FULL_63_24]